eukprot:gene891-996_t
MAHMSRSLSQRILSPDVIMQSMYGRGPLSPEVHGMSVGGIMRRPDSSDQLDEMVYWFNEPEEDAGLNLANIDYDDSAERDWG